MEREVRFEENAVPRFHWLHSHNHRNDNYVGKWYEGKKKRREARNEDGSRFLRWPAASSSFANYPRKHRVNCYTLFDRSCFFIFLWISFHLFVSLLAASLDTLREPLTEEEVAKVLRGSRMYIRHSDVDHWTMKEING